MSESTEIRPLEVPDAQLIYEAIQESGQYISRRLPGISASLSMADIRKWIASAKREWANGTAYHFVMVSDGCVAGACG